MRIEDLQEEFVDSVLSIANSAFSPEIQRGMPAFTEGYFFRRMEMEDVFIRVAIIERELVGFCMLILSEIHVIHLLAVDQFYRERGIGKMLIKDALEIAGTGKVEVNVRPWNSIMRKLCEDMGFREIGFRKRGYLGEPLVKYVKHVC